MHAKSESTLVLVWDGTEVVALGLFRFPLSDCTARHVLAV